ncbi:MULTISPECIES: hypothetical protein [Streptomyces]|uniref:Uncharacterized protein n=1 Tax=Streptomyces griseosporeus TaxID=1910 RepID=A0ABV3KLL3_STRGS|nr:hypothetical protein [Streptomyces actuosus]MBM4821960.1 hypothetical protein [Streptomyces actuosus]
MHATRPAERGARCVQGRTPGAAVEFPARKRVAWLWQRLGRHSALGRAVEIEREAQEADVLAVELFFALWDEYRRGPQPTAG